MGDVERVWVQQLCVPLVLIFGFQYLRVLSSSMYPHHLQLLILQYHASRCCVLGKDGFVSPSRKIPGVGIIVQPCVHVVGMINLYIRRWTVLQP